MNLSTGSVSVKSLMAYFIALTGFNGFTQKLKFYEEGNS
jgi:hypothetical protein